MSIRERKLSLIETVLAIGDTRLLDKVETFFKEELNGGIQRMTIEEYRAEIAKSMEDVQAGRVITHEQLKEEIAQW